MSHYGVVNGGRKIPMINNTVNNSNLRGSKMSDAQQNNSVDIRSHYKEYHDFPNEFIKHNRFDQDDLFGYKNPIEATLKNKLNVQSSKYNSSAKGLKNRNAYYRDNSQSIHYDDKISGGNLLSGRGKITIHGHHS